MKIELVPGIKAAPWRTASGRGRDLEEWGEVRLRILSRDRYTCCACGFRSRGDEKAPPWTLRRSGYLEIHHINDDHEDNRDDNLATLCPLCHAVFSLGLTAHRGGVLIYFPWLDQARINLLVNVAMCARIREGEYEFSAASLLGWLKNHAGPLAEAAPALAGDGRNVGTALHFLVREDPQTYRRRKDLFENVRVLPNLDHPDMIRAFQWFADNAWLPEVQWDRLDGAV